MEGVAQGINEGMSCSQWVAVHCYGFCTAGKQELSCGVGRDGGICEGVGWRVHQG